MSSGGSLSIIGKSHASGKTVLTYLADIPGKEFAHSESSTLINTVYNDLQAGLDAIAAGKASLLSLRPAERSPRRL